MLTWIDFSLQFLNGYFEKCSKLDGTLEVAILRAQGMSFRVADFVVSNSACVELNQSQAIVHKALLGWEKALHPISEKQKSVQFWIVLNGLLVFARRFLACHYLYPAITSDEQLAVANWEDLFIACFQVFARVTSELDDLQNHEQTMITIQLFVDFLGSEYLYAKRTQMFFDLLQSLLKLFQTKKLQPSDILHYVPLIRLILHRIILQSSSADVFKYQSALNVWLNLLKQQHFSRDEDNLFYERLHVDLISCF